MKKRLNFLENLAGYLAKKSTERVVTDKITIKEDKSFDMNFLKKHKSRTNKKKT